MKTRYKNVYVSADRHGKLRARYRKAGKEVYLKALPDQPGFEAELKEVIGYQGATSPNRPIPGSVADLLTRYYRSADFMAKGAPEDRHRRRLILESFRKDFGNDLVADFGFEHIEAILLARTEKRVNERGRMVGGQVAAVNLRKQLRRLFALARKLKWIDSNPVEEADKVGKTRLTGFVTWEEDHIELYQKRHPFGTKARLALEIILWTGQRRGDARLFGPKHVVNGMVQYQQGKTGTDVWLPASRDLLRAIHECPAVGIITYLVTDYGKPYSKDGFGNKMRQWCDEADLPKELASHGLRKAIARRMAQMRATEHEIMAVGGWKSASQIKVYTEAIARNDLAESAIAKIDGHYSTEKDPQSG
ncbi:MAG TPA: tyrosine-type recombinase/integrase [Sphingobium sp.]|nr:tyrosine-type recombinase/integrase [Sphingobium sp.]